MLSTVPDVLALADRLKACEQRRADYSTLLNLVSKYHVNERFPELSEYLLSQAEIAGDEYLFILRENVPGGTGTGHSQDTITRELAAEMLGVSVKFIYRLERNPRKMREIGYPGRKVTVKFFNDWATPLRTARMLRKAARERSKRGQ